MSAIGSLVFCNDCGNLLDADPESVESVLTCSCCGAQWKDSSKKKVVSISKPTAFPSTLRSKRSAVQTLTEEDFDIDATIRKTCPKCGAEEMRFHTKQLRGADEGTTVFYSCTCGHRFNDNN